jgi:hypothetical protein
MSLYLDTLEALPIALPSDDGGIYRKRPGKPFPKLKPKE